MVLRVIERFLKRASSLLEIEPLPVIVKENSFSWRAYLASVTRAVKVKLPVEVGVPEIVPELLKVSPDGRLLPPDSDHL